MLGGSLVAVIASLARRRLDPTTGTVGPRVVAGAAAAVFALLLASRAVVGGRSATTPAQSRTELGITSQSMAFSTGSLTADAGEVTVRLTNHDLSWHTFTIDALSVDIKVPVNADGSATFRATPGTYAFYCSVPGHAPMGMRGTLTVR